MVCAMMIGRKGSVGFPGKNIFPVLGRPLAAYPLLAANSSSHVKRVFVSTDCPDIMTIAKEHGAELIDRPPELASKEALGEDVFEHGYHEIKRRLQKEGLEIELLVLLFANGATLNKDLIDQGVATLRNNKNFDSAVTTSIYNMWSPLRARKLDADGCLNPMVPFETFGDPRTLNCDRDSQGDVHFADMAVSVVRPECLENMAEGLLPQKWMGQRIAPISNWGGCDVDYEWQIPMVEFWLRKHGIQEA
ncbi:MAG: cytidylyltransferase [Nitrospina sp.]|nr:cytidylyltransferase [Nitrospina sp.]